MPRPYDNDLRRTCLTAYASGITEALALITPDNDQAWFRHSMATLQQL